MTITPSEVLGREADACYARWSYERLQLLQPDIRCGGLWFFDGWYFATCPDLEPSSVAADGTSLATWFAEEGKAIGAPVKLTKTAPADATLVPERTIGEQTSLVGAPLTVRNLVSLLSISVPTSLPAFDFKTQPPVATLYVARALLPYEDGIFRETVAPYLGRMTLDVVVDEHRFSQDLGFRYPSFMQGDLDLVPARRLPKSYSAGVKMLIEADEGQWPENRNRVFGQDVERIEVPASFAPDTSRCLIDASAFPPRNLRMAVALYGQVQIAMPLESSYNAALEGFKTTEDDLVALAESGRVVFLLPQSVDRYPQSLVHKLAEAKRDAMMLSRTLGALTLQEQRRRIPFLYANLSPSERHKILSAFSQSGNGSHQALSKALASEIGRIWATTPDSVAFRGAMGLMASGIGQLLATIIQCLTGRELRLEMWSAGAGVEWAAALGSTIVPYDGDTYSEQELTEMLSAAYSGVEDRQSPSKVGDVEAAVQGLLSINNDAPILDLAQAFSGNDVNRMRKLVFSMENPIESISEAVETFNEKVVHYERTQSRLERLDLMTLVGAFSVIPALATGHPMVAGYMPLGAWLAKYFLQNADLTRDVGGGVAERLRAINSFTSRDVVMVSRLRKTIKEPVRR